MLYHEKRARALGFTFTVGVDEVGRGPLAGPVVAAAVRLKTTKFNNLITDSKKLKAEDRQSAFLEINQKATVGIGMMSESVIDSVNILNATKLAMEQAVSNLFYSTPRRINKNRVIVLVDGNAPLNLPFKSKNIIGGDSKSMSIAAASIVAKVIRDRIMSAYHSVYPKYSFLVHKGYGTRQHFKAIKKHGACAIHRLSFSPFK